MLTDARSLYYRLAHQRYDQRAHPYWHGDVGITLGDYGRIAADGSFACWGNIYREGIVSTNVCAVIGGETPVITADVFAFGCHYGMKAAGQLADSVDVEIEFTNEESLLIHVDQLFNTSIGQLKKLQQVLIARCQEKKWDRQAIIVTELLTAKKLRYFVYQGGAGKIELRASISPMAFNLKRDFGLLNLTNQVNIKTELFLERALPEASLFVFKAKRLVKPVLDLIGNPRLEVQAADRLPNTDFDDSDVSDEWILGEA